MRMEGRLLAPDNQVGQRSNARAPTQRAREAFGQPVDKGQCAPDDLQPLCTRCWTTRKRERKTAGEGRTMTWHETCGRRAVPLTGVRHTIPLETLDLAEQRIASDPELARRKALVSVATAEHADDVGTLEFVERD